MKLKSQYELVPDSQTRTHYVRRYLLLRVFLARLLDGDGVSIALDQGCENSSSPQRHTVIGYSHRTSGNDPPISHSGRMGDAENSNADSVYRFRPLCAETRSQQGTAHQVPDGIGGGCARNISGGDD